MPPSGSRSPLRRRPAANSGQLLTAAPAPDAGPAGGGMTAAGHRTRHQEFRLVLRHPRSADRPFRRPLLVALTDRAEVATGEIDQDVVDRALADTDAMIDGYIAARYALPLAAT